MPKNLLFYSQLKDNNFNLLRLIAAVLVLFSHSYPLSGNNSSEWLSVVSHGFMSFGSLAVSCFFIISGYLIAASMLNRKNLKDYFVSRILRIFPGLVISVLICVFVVGPLVTTSSLRAYFSSTETYTFLIHNSFLWRISFVLPGVFASNPFPGAVNGSLWTLPAEFSLYIFIALLGAVKMIQSRNKSSMVILVFLIAPFFLNIFCGFFSSYVHILHIMPPFLCFGLGALFYLWREKIFLHWMVLLILVCLTFSLHHFEIFNFLFYLTEAYAIFWLAYHQKIKGNRMTQWGDFSYGIYIYAFPVQQILMYYFKISTSSGLFLLALPITLLLAVLSWHLIEKPALKLKQNEALTTIFRKSYKALHKPKAALSP